MVLLQQQQTYKYTSMVLQQRYPGERGFSEMSICLFHRSKGITTKTANNDNVHGTIDMQNETHKLCVFHVTQLVASFGLELVVRSWNEHPIRGIYIYFIPNDKMYTIIVIH